MKDWYQYRPWNLTHSAQLRESGHMTYPTTALLPNSCGPMADGPFRNPKGRSYLHLSTWNLYHRAQLRESGHMTYHTTALLPNSCGPLADGPFRDPKGRSHPHHKYWTHRWRIDINIDHWNLTHSAQLRESGHMTYHTTALLPNSCGPMADGPFRDPKGRSYPQPK